MQERRDAETVTCNQELVIHHFWFRMRVQAALNLRMGSAVPVTMR